MSLYTVYMARIARALQAQGFPIIQVVPNPKNKRYNVYLFEDSPDFQAALFKILNP